RRPPPPEATRPATSVRQISHESSEASDSCSWARRNLTGCVCNGCHGRSRYSHGRNALSRRRFPSKSPPPGTMINAVHLLGGFSNMPMLDAVLRHLRKLAEAQAARELSDAELLDRFRSRREESAFSLLVQRHGPMVLGVCQRVLFNLHDAEDAFQAIF